MPLNPQVVAVLQQLAQFPAPDFASESPAEIRAKSDVPMQLGEPPAVARVEDLQIALPGRTLAARLYVPQGAGEVPPLTLFYHGGGWVIGTLDTHDATCRALARASGSAVLSVAYRLAPEHPYPAAMEDAFDSLCWAASHAGELGVDDKRLAVAGDSAGGNLAAAAALAARDRGGPPLRHQLLLYPVIEPDFTRTSYVANGGEGSFLTTAMMRWFWDQYLGNTPTEQAPLASLLHGHDHAGLPPATVAVAEFDPLHDEGLDYADALRQAGVPVQVISAPGMIHGFVSMFEAIPDALPFIDQVGHALAQALAVD